MEKKTAEEKIEKLKKRIVEKERLHARAWDMQVKYRSQVVKMRKRLQKLIK
jgi:hypothetical protein